MTQNQKAVAQLKDCGIEAKELNDTVYVFCGDTPVEISEYEIKFREHLYDTHQIDLDKTK
jgi:hypothetical protein